MTLISAIIYAAAGFVAAVIYYFWQIHHALPDAPAPHIWATLQRLGGYGVINAFMIYIWGAISGMIRRDKAILSAPALAAIFGLPFWFIILPAHLHLMKAYDLPTSILLAEIALLCGVSFEAIRLLSKLVKKRG